MSITGRFRIDRGEFVLDVEFSLPGNGVTALFGRSGSGKTTLLRCLAGLERSPGGRLTVNGHHWQSKEEFVPTHKRPIGMVFQAGCLFPHLKVAGNLAYGFRRQAEGARWINFADTVELLGIGDLLDRYPDQLSGGQQQRVAIARALLTSPELLLMDEPMASLDETSKHEIFPYLKRLRDELAIPIVYVSHVIEEVAQLADHMLLIADGRIVANDTLQALLTRTDLPLARSEHASSVIEGHIQAHHPEDHLSELTIPGGSLFVSQIERPIGAPVRVRILARDVSISLTPPGESSLLNYVDSVINEVTDDPQPGQIMLRLAVGEQQLLARISQRSCRQLALAAGQPVLAAVKSVALA